ncbi:hypothetical protein DL768_011819 [Monosporascus sp. mg162]|nr:hypothetical protein DL768_011819 [Monosporascus sp. mg162]
MVQLLLNKGAEIDSKDNNNRTPLSWAAGNGHKEIVQLLLDKGAEADSNDKDGRTPLLWIAEHNIANVFAFLTARPSTALQDYQMQLRLLEHQNKKRLMLARGEADPATVMQLLLDNGAEADPKDRDGRTPLSWAAEKGHKEVVQMLLDKGAEADSKDKDGQTPLLRAAKKGHKEIMQLLLDSGAEADVKGNDNRTPLS